MFSYSFDLFLGYEILVSVPSSVTLFQKSTSLQVWKLGV